jgi:hypothetical protein
MQGWRALGFAFGLAVGLSEAAPSYAQQGTTTPAGATQPALQQIALYEYLLYSSLSSASARAAASGAMPASRPGYFTNGAAATTVSPSDAYFTNGAAATSAPLDSATGVPFFANGAALTTVPLDSASGNAYFANGAALTTVAPGSPYFTNGAAVTSVPLTAGDVERSAPKIEARAVTPASAEKERPAESDHAAPTLATKDEARADEASRAGGAPSEWIGDEGEDLSNGEPLAQDETPLPRLQLTSASLERPPASTSSLRHGLSARTATTRSDPWSGPAVSVSALLAIVVVSVLSSRRGRSTAP